MSDLFGGKVPAPRGAPEATPAPDSGGGSASLGLRRCAPRCYRAVTCDQSCTSAPVRGDEPA
jgi:hypothetical protein